MTALSSEAVVAVIGAGAMGSGIAQVAAVADHRVLLFDANPDAPAKAVAGIAKGLAGQVEKGRMSADKRQGVLDRLKPITSLGEAAGAAIAIEAVVEDLAIKQRLFSELEAILAPGAILATNTSSLSISAIAKGLRRPERVVGMHFFNPAPILPLVEVVSGLTTDHGVAATVFDTAAAWGKTPVHAKSTPGFIVNRCARPFYAEALRLLGEHATDPATLDAVLREAGRFRMGPCELMDLVGHDVNFAVTSAVFGDYFGDPRYRPSPLQREMVEAGRLGRKSGRGFFDYSPGAPAPVPRGEPAAPKPARAAIEGGLGPAEPLLERLPGSGIAFKRVDTSAGGAIVLDGAILRLTDGRTATARAVGHEPNLVLFDLSLDYAKTGRIALAPSDTASSEARASAVGFFQALGMAVSLVDDAPGLIVARTIAMLVNEAAEAVLHGVAAPADIDLAMTKGVNYPGGPFAWLDRLGIGYVVSVLDNLGAAYGEDRYRVSSWLRRRAAAQAQKRS
jgi:3-hydroxybutyryl-CoA dehydrogenase